MKHKAILTAILLAALGLIIVTIIAVQNDPLLNAFEEFLMAKLQVQEEEVDEPLDDGAHSTMLSVAMPTEWDYVFTLGSAHNFDGAPGFIGIRADGTIVDIGFEDMDDAARGFWRLIAEDYPSFLEEACRDQFLEGLLDSTLTIGGDEFEAVEVIEEEKP